MENAKQHLVITVNDIARTCHEANRSLQLALGELASDPWGESTKAIKDSAIDGVLARLRGTSTAEDMHDNWFRFKAAQGYVHGPEKNEEKKTHPCMVPYEELPEDQKAKDHLFSAIVDSLKPLLINAKDFA